MAHTGLFVAPVAGSTPVGMSPTDGRLVLGALYGTTAQLVSGGAFTPSASAMTATVAQAVWQLPDVTNTAATFLSPTDLTNLTFAAAPGTGGRYDLVCTKQNNVENADADSRSNVFVVAGVASGTPLVPATPAGASVYLKVLISAGQTNLAAATVTNFMQTTFRGPDLNAPTLAALNTVTGLTGQHATVNADPTAANNGDYIWSGSAWVIPGSLVPQIWVDRSSVSVGGGSGFNLLATSTWWTQVKNVGFAAFNGTIVIPVTGRYRIEVGTLMTGALTGCYLVVTRNNSAASNTGAVLSVTGSAAAGVAVTQGAKEIALTAGDVLRVVVDPNNTWTWDTDINSGWFGARYLGS